MFSKNFSEIEFSDIAELVGRGQTESQSLEYKEMVWDTSDSSKMEMLRDITSMANKYGGIFIIGIKENSSDGKATSIVDVTNSEDERDRIYSSCLSNISPRITGMKMRCLEGDDKHLLLIYVPNSFLSPHMIIFQGKNEFWIRHDRQKSRMTIEEIRDAVIKSINLTKSVEDFIKERREEILSINNTKPTMMLGAVPLSLQNKMIDITDLTLREKLRNSPGSSKYSYSFTFEHIQPRPSLNGIYLEGEGYWYSMELFRSGYLESIIDISEMLEEVKLGPQFQDATNSGEVIDVNIIMNRPLVEYIYSFTKQVKQIAEHVGFEGEYIFFLKLYNIKDLGLNQYKPGRMLVRNVTLWKSLHLELPIMTFSIVDPIKITKEIADRVWQSYGYEGEPFLKDGDFVFE